MSFSFEDHLEASRQSMTRSREASDRAKDFMDAGYVKRQERDLAVEELRESVEHLTSALEKIQPPVKRRWRLLRVRKIRS